MSCHSVAVVLTLYMKRFVHIVGSNKKYFAARQQRTGKPFSRFMAKLDTFLLLRATCVCKIQTERTAALSQHFPYFRRVCPSRETSLIASSYTSVRPSVCPHAPARLPLAVFWQNAVLWIYIKICQENLNLVKLAIACPAFHII